MRRPIARDINQRKRAVGSQVSSWVNPFSPLELSPALWLDASDGSTFTYSSGTLVSQWNDKSGNNRHATQSSSTSQPDRSGTLNGLSTVVFDGSNDFFTLGDVLDLGTNDLTVAVVVKRTSGTNATIIGKYKVTPLNGMWLLLRETTLRTVYKSSNLSGAFTSTTWTATTAQQITAVITRGTTGTIQDYINSSANTPTSIADTADKTTSHNNSVSAYIGALRDSTDTGFIAGYYWTGEIAEVLVFLSALNNTDRGKVETYLKNKWRTS